jgi:Domain of unknown function (DUF4253)
MGQAAVPDDGEIYIDSLWARGRRVYAQHSRTKPLAAIAWITDRAERQPGGTWSTLSRAAAKTGLQPILLRGLDAGDTTRPWDDGEFGEPEDAASIDQLDAAGLLQSWYEGAAPDEGELEEDEEFRAMLEPFGAQFPGLAPALHQELDPELMQRALHQYTGDARIGLVPAARPADVVTRLGWDGACNHRTSAELSAVLRSWEDRFGARLLEVGFAEVRLLVSRPPQTLPDALPIAAEHVAFCDEAASRGLNWVSGIAAALVSNPFWDFWWD